MIKSSIPEESRYSSKESINTEIEKDIIPEMLCKDGNKLSESIHQSNHLELCDDEKLKNEKNNYKDVSSVKILETIRENYKNNEEECKNISNVMKKNLNHSENKEQCYQSFRDKPNEFIHDIEEYTSSKNGEHFDITDDESSDSDNEIVLVLDEIESKQKQESKSIPSDINNIYDDLNITDDESDSNMEVQDTLQRSVTSLDRQENSQSKFSIKKKEVADETKIKKESIRLDNNNSNRKTRKNSIHDIPECTNSKDIVNISTLNLEVTPRITRSRRASSITKEINSSPLSSPSKVPSKTSRSRRASSLVKEVLLGSIVSTDENIKQTISSGSEGLSEMSTPKRTRGKRASSITKDVSIETEGEEVKIPIRRSSRRSASVQKELEPVKSLSKNDEILSTSNISTEGNMKKVQTKSTSSKMKQSSGGAKKSNANSSKLTKEYKTNEQEIEESSTIKSSRKRSSSVSKETISLIQSRRTSNVTKEIISQEIKSPLEEIEEQFLMKQVINRPTANTRSRRSSIQSIPEELEEILSVPSKKRISTANKRQQNSRMRRAASVDLSQTEIKRKTRSTRSKGIFEETIIEEEIIETTNPVDDFNNKEVVMKKKRTTSDSSNQKIDGSRKTRKSIKQDTKDKEANQFLFSQPEKTKDLPLDQKAIGEVPKYMFSPPHTRSKTTTSDLRRKINFIPILSDDEDEGEDGKETQNIIRKTTEMRKPGYYIRCRTKFVLPMRSKHTSN